MTLPLSYSRLRNAITGDVLIVSCVFQPISSKSLIIRAAKVIALRGLFEGSNSSAATSISIDSSERMKLLAFSKSPAWAYAPTEALGDISGNVGDCRQ